MLSNKKILALVLGIVMTISMAACGNHVNKTSQKDQGKYGTIWSLPSTVKVEQYDVDFSEKQGMELNYHAVRNEYESMQLIITAEKDIDRFYLQKSDLKSGDKVLSADNIDVYVQKYVPYNDVNGNGSMPDALLPIDTADEYEEIRQKRALTEQCGLQYTHRRI